MPIVLPAQSQSSSSGQVVATAQIFDYLQTDQGVAIADVEVRCVLAANVAVTISPIVMVRPTELVTRTDGNGFFSFNVIPNNNLNPANTTYTISTPFRQYRISVPSGGPYQTTAFGIIVDTPVALAPAVTGITGQLTIQAGGLIVAAGGAHIRDGLFVDTGTFTIATGGFTMAGPLTLTAPASEIVPGSASFSVRNSADLLDNLLVTDSGVVTARAGFTLTAGLMTLPAASVADSALSANVPLKNAANTFSVLQTISSGGLAVTGGITAVTGGVTATAGNLVATTGNLVFAAASAKIVPGATSLLVRNNADAATNLGITDVGLATYRNAVEIPPSAGAALPTHSYGTLPVKLDEQSTASAALLTLTVPAGALYRSLLIHFTGRSDQAGAQNLQVQFNADTGNNYDYQLMQDLNATLSGVAPGIAGAIIVAAILVPTGAVAGAETNAEMTVMNADSATLRKQIHAYSGGFEADAAANARLTIMHGQWRNTAAAITSIKLFPAAGNLISARAVLFGCP